MSSRRRPRGSRRRTNNNQIVAPVFPYLHPSWYEATTAGAIDYRTPQTLAGQDVKISSVEVTVASPAPATFWMMIINGGSVRETKPITVHATPTRIVLRCNAKDDFYAVPSTGTTPVYFHADWTGPCHLSMVSRFTVQMKEPVKMS